MVTIMEVAMPPELSKYVESLVQKEGYSGSNEVIAEALRQHRASRPVHSIVMTPQLEKLLDEGMEDIGKATTTKSIVLN
jgi:Arc/MetJ-type ribon-helix-helix transcriptional regulator